MSNQKGLSPILVILVLAAAIGVGTFLVQTRTNILPFAAENAGTSANLEDVPTFSGSPTSIHPIPSNKQAKLNEYLEDSSKGTVKCVDNVLWTYKEDGSQDEFIIDCRDEAVSSSQRNNLKCGTNSAGPEYNVGNFGCFNAADQQDLTGKSPFEDYANLSEAECRGRGSAQFCADNGRFVREYAVWENGSCVTKRDDLRVCSASDKYKNGESYQIPSGQQGSGVEAEFKDIGDRVSPEVEKLAEQCGLKDASENTLGIPFFKIGFGNNPSVNSEECRRLLSEQLKYFEQANQRALTKLQDEARKKGLVVEKDSSGNYIVKVDPNISQNDPQWELAEQQKGDIEKYVQQVNSAQKAIEDCQKKSGATEQSECIDESQTATQKAAEEAQKLALSGYLEKFEAIVTGAKKNGCVKADLGVAPFMEAKRLKARGSGGSEGKPQRTFHRLLLCSGASGDLKWRVLVGGESGAEFSDDGEDKGNDSERIYELHGTTDDASGPPNFGTGFKINECVTLTGQTEASVRADLEDYINAAKNGTINLPGCKKPSNPNDTGGNGSERRAGESSGVSDTTGSGGSSSGGTQSSGNNQTGTGGKTNVCQSDKACVDKNGEGFKCENGNCIYRGPNCKDTGCPVGRRCASSGQCVSCPGGVCP